MKIFGRQDVLPLIGLAAAIVVLFSAPISRLFSFARQVEEQSGLSLVPALVMLAVVLILHEVRKRYQAQTAAAVAETVRREGDIRAEETERLVSFGQGRPSPATRAGARRRSGGAISRSSYWPARPARARKHTPSAFR